MRVGQKPGHWPGRAVHAARIVVCVRKLGTLEHPIAENSKKDPLIEIINFLKSCFTATLSYDINF